MTRDTIFASFYVSPIFFHIDRDFDLGVDAKSGCVYCTECGDFIYDSMVEEMRLAAVVKAEEKRTRFQGVFSHEYA